MSEEAGEKKVKLTPNDPVPKETLLELEQLAHARAQIADRFLALEQGKIPLLAAAKRVEEQKARAFDEVLTLRGIAPGTPVEIDTSTGALKLIGQQEPSPQAPPQAPPEPPAEQPEEKDEAPEA